MAEVALSRSVAWQVVILVLSVLTLVFVAFDTLFELTAEMSSLFYLVDTAICVVFLADVAYRGILHPDRRAYWRWGWLDLLSSIPAVAFLRWGRLFRIVRIVRVLRAFRSTRALVGHLFRDPAQGSVFTVALATFTLVVFASIAMLNLEASAPAANIRTASDALWWSFVTVTTVGYGDHFPTTGAGRAIAAILMAAGVGLFGTLTAYLANAWLTRRSGQDGADGDARALADQVAVLVAKIEALERAVERRGP
jgi:voltage-gated potassium channel